MSSEKPTILLIPGAWLPATAFEDVATILRAEGYPVHTMTLLSVGGPTSTTAADDAEDIRRRYLNQLITEGKEVIVVMHSYSGIPGTESVKSLARKDLAAQGKKGGVIALIYVTAFLIAAGQSVASILGENMDIAMSFDGDKVYPRDPREKFYNDLADEIAAKHVSELVYHAKASFYTPLTYEAYRDVPTTFLLCKRDASIPFEVQQGMAAAVGEGVVRTYTCEGAHCAMSSVPKEVADVIHDTATNGVAW